MRLSSTTVGRFVAALAALAAPVAVLAATAVPAQAAAEVTVCRATNSDSNPYVALELSSDSPEFQRILDRRGNPDKVWNSDGNFGPVPHDAGDPKPDLISNYVDNGETFTYDGEFDSIRCLGFNEEEPPVFEVDFFDPTCEAPKTLGYDVAIEGADFTVDGLVRPGQTVTLTATAFDGGEFPNGDDTITLTHTFAQLGPEDCDPRVLIPEEPDYVEATCDTAPYLVLPDELVAVEPDARRADGLPLVGTAEVDGLLYTVRGAVEAGGEVEVTVSAIEPNQIAEGAPTTFRHTFAAAPTAAECGGVLPPVTQVNPVVTPQLVNAGLGTEQGGSDRGALVWGTSLAVLVIAAAGVLRRRAR